MSITDDTTSVEVRLDRIESRTEINDLVAKYCSSIDRRELDVFLGLWHQQDAEFLIPGRGEFAGPDGLRRSQDVIRGVWETSYHWTTNHTVEFESPDRASGRSDCYAICVRTDGTFCHVSCTYYDSYERRDGSWKFVRRFVDRYFVSAPVDTPLLPPS